MNGNYYNVCPLTIRSTGIITLLLLYEPLLCQKGLPTDFVHFVFFL